MPLTTPRTVSKYLQELLKDAPYDPDLPAIRGDRDGSEANISEISDAHDSFVLVLDDGSKFMVKVAQKL